jgi:hypothetical protein
MLCFYVGLAPKEVAFGYKLRLARNDHVNFKGTPTFSATARSTLVCLSVNCSIKKFPF